METCKHKNKKRLYERGDSWTSIPVYKCQDCGELIEITLKKVAVYTTDEGVNKNG